MEKSEVYSWRLSPELKGHLAAAAKEEGVSMAEFLERIARAWLRDHRDEEEEERQRELHEAARASLGSIAGGDPKRSRSTRDGLAKALGSRRKRRTS